jgi:hypothetical protein
MLNLSSLLLIAAVLPVKIISSTDLELYVRKGRSYIFQTPSVFGEIFVSAIFGILAVWL